MPLFKKAGSCRQGHALIAMPQAMHPETIDGNMLKLTGELAILGEFSFYLAGGTGLSLQTGHRKSFDFDFFSHLLAGPKIKVKGVRNSCEILAKKCVFI